MNKKLIIGITAPQSTILLKGQLKYLSNKGFDVYLLANDTKRTREFCKIENATLLPIDVKRKISIFHDLRTLFKAVSIFRQTKPDIINLGTAKISLLGLLAGLICRVPKRIQTCRGFRFEHEKGFLRLVIYTSEKIMSMCAHKVIAISDSVRELGIRKNVFTKEKSLVIGKGSSNGLDFVNFNPAKYSEAQKNKIITGLGIDNYFVFGFVGRIIERKGFFELIEAFDRVYDRDKNVRLVVCGRPYYDQIDRQIIERAENHPGIIMTGLVPYEEVPLYMMAFDTFVLPAYWEGFGNVLIQAAAMGVPVISTNVTGCKDAVSDGFNGELIPVNSVTALVDSMIKFRDEKDLRKKYGENGIEWSKNFNSEVIWDGMADLFLEV